MQQLIDSGADLSFNHPKEKAFPLFAACDSNFPEAARSLIAAGVNVDQVRLEDGCDVVYIAAHCGYADILRLLIKAGASVKRLVHGCSALGTCAQEGHAECIELLLEAGADPLHRTPGTGLTPLECALKYQRLAASTVLRKHFEKICSGCAAPSPSFACSKCHCVKYCSASCQRSHWKAHKQHCAPADEQNQLIAFFNACIAGNVEAVRRGIAGGNIDVNKVLQQNNFPLMAAALSDNVEITNMLLSAGADVHLVAPISRRSAFRGAAEKGSCRVMRILLAWKGSSRPIDIDQMDSCGMLSCTPLFVAAEFGHVEAVRLLVDSGASVDLARPDNITPLFNSAGLGRLEIVRILLAAGADAFHRVAVPEWPERDWPTVESIAVQNGHLECARIIREHKAKSRPSRR